MGDSSITLRTALQHLDETLPPVSQGPAYPGASLSTVQLANAATQIVSETFDVERLLLRGRKRGARRLAHARTVAMALVHLVGGRSQEDTANAFRRNRTTASNHMERTEDLNEVAKVEAWWDLMALRFTKLVELMEVPLTRPAWLLALQALEAALHNGDLEGDAVDQARHVLGVFLEDRCEDAA